MKTYTLLFCTSKICKAACNSLMCTWTAME